MNEAPEGRLQGLDAFPGVSTAERHHEHHTSAARGVEALRKSPDRLAEAQVTPLVARGGHQAQTDQSSNTTRDDSNRWPVSRA
jgi:hypothetical protein